MDALRNMEYSGRGICVGMTFQGNSFLAYTLTGRSRSSRARALLQEEPTKTIRTEVICPGQLAHGSAALLIYPAIAPILGVLAASNGIQTELIYSAVMRNPHLVDSNNPEQILRDAFKEPQWRYDQGNEKSRDRWIDITTYEPDNPNFTPRISALLKDNIAATHIVWRDEDGRKQELYRSFVVEPGHGKMLATYKGGNEKPLVSFKGDLLSLDILEEDIGVIADSFYQAICGHKHFDDNFRVAVAVALYNKSSSNLEFALRNRSEISK